MYYRTEMRANISNMERARSVASDHGWHRKIITGIEREIAGGVIDAELAEEIKEYLEESLKFMKCFDTAPKDLVTENLKKLKKILETIAVTNEKS